MFIVFIIRLKQRWRKFGLRGTFRMAWVSNCVATNASSLYLKT